MKRNILLSWALVTLFRVADAQKITMYVSPDGNDKNAGKTPDAPLGTVQKALSNWAAIKANGTGISEISILLKGGTYQLTEPIRITPHNGGSASSKLFIRSVDNEKAVFNGAKKISGWKKSKNNIWVAAVPEAKAGTWNFSQLYVNGALKTLARFPNEGFFTVSGFPDGGEEVVFNTVTKRFEFQKGDINPQWKNLEDVQVVVYHFWTDTHMVIDTVDPKTRIVTFKHKSSKRFTDDFTRDGARYIVENVLEGLDRPGEWYLDRHRGLLYYMPLPGENMATSEVLAPFTKEFIRFEGASNRDLVENVTLENIAFKYSNFVLPENDANDYQASATIPASVTAIAAKNIALKNCSFTNLGNFAFDIQKACSNISVVANKLEHLAAGAFKINGGTETDPLMDRTRNITVYDNEILHYGEKYPSAVGILLMNAEGCYIGHNHIFDGWYTGISVGWVWGYQQSISRDNIIEYNHIHKIGQGLLSDMGGIYTLGVSPGTIIRNNLIYDVESNRYGGWGIYNDEGSTHILIENNIVYNTKFAAYNIHYAKELTVRNNIFALGRLEVMNRGRQEPHKTLSFENNIVYWNSVNDPFTGNWKDQPYVFHTNPNNGTQPTLNVTFSSDYNLFFNPTKPADSIRYNGLAFSDWQQKGKDVHSVYADPMFVNPEHYDFTLKTGSPALQMGFKNINMKDVGPRNINQ
jgi:hypothetical protein